MFFTGRNVCLLYYLFLYSRGQEYMLKTTLQQKSYLCNPFLRTAWSQSQFPHVSVSDLYIPLFLFIYSYMFLGLLDPDPDSFVGGTDPSLFS
jgi:hypothetical protein